MTGGGLFDDFFVPTRVIPLGECQRNVATDYGAECAPFRENPHVYVNHKIADGEQRRGGMKLGPRRTESNANSMEAIR